MHKNVFAYTAPGPQPEFLSINRHNGLLTVAVRGSDGSQAEMVLPDNVTRELANGLMADRSAQRRSPAEQAAHERALRNATSA